MIRVGVAVVVVLVDMNVDIWLGLEESLPGGVAQMAIINVERR